MAVRRRLARRRRRLGRRKFRQRLNFNSLSVNEVRERYRFTAGTINFILGLVGGDLEAPTRRSKVVSPLLQIMIALRYFATGAFFKLIGDSVGVSEATVSRCVYRVADALARKATDFIRFPDDQNAARVKREFYELSRFPNVIGCIDCTHIRIQGPKENEQDFINRKGFHSLNVQMTCDSKFKITSCVAKWPGSVHDARIFRDSTLCTNFENGVYDGLLLGDSGYPCHKFLMTPYNAPQERKEIKFNGSLCRARVTIEQTFGILKRRFACLGQVIRLDPSKAAIITLACAVLHNIAIDNNEEVELTDEIIQHQDDNNIFNNLHGDGARIRDHLCTTYFS